MSASVVDAQGPSPARLTVLCVLVLYGRSLANVPAWRYLTERLARPGAVPRNERAFVLDQILIYDNSPSPAARPLGHWSGVTWFHDASNGGTAAAYALACCKAAEADIDWLLLLDQDTTLPDNFFDAAGECFAHHECHPRVLLPWVFDGGRVVSPARVTRRGSIAPLRFEPTLPTAYDLTALASGSLLHVPTVSTLLPLPACFWLDYVDHWIFLALRRRGCVMAVFATSLQHHLSVCDVASLSARRLVSILDGEAHFTAQLNRAARIAYPFRVVARVARYAWVSPKLAVRAIGWIGARIRSLA